MSWPPFGSTTEHLLITKLSDIIKYLKEDLRPFIARASEMFDRSLLPGHPGHVDERLPL
jgi:hypothetical protein